MSMLGSPQPDTQALGPPLPTRLVQARLPRLSSFAVFSGRRRSATSQVAGITLASPIGDGWPQGLGPGLQGLGA